MEKLVVEGIDVEIVDVCLLYFLDCEILVVVVKKIGKVLFVIEDNKEGSVMSEIVVMILEDVFFDLDVLI